MLYEPSADGSSQCDLVRPACSRCTRRGIDCSGFPDDAGFIFLNENVAAQRNSRRARGERGQDPVNTTDRRVQQDRQLHQASDMTDEFWRQQYPWLNARALGEAPEPLKRDIETRAVERFFVNWILYPSNHGVSTGRLGYSLVRTQYHLIELQVICTIFQGCILESNLVQFSGMLYALLLLRI